jgi:RNA-binding protein
MLNSKQKAYLKKIASTLPSQFQVGKVGLSDNLIYAVDDYLRVNELVKISLLKTTEDDVETLSQVFAKNTQSEIVQIIGRTMILYRRNKEKPVIELPSGVKKQ